MKLQNNLQNKMSYRQNNKAPIWKFPLKFETVKSGLSIVYIEGWVACNKFA